MAMLEARNVTKYFGRLAAVNNLSFDVKRGEIFGIAGPNGAGKTTLFNLIAGTYPCKGEILFEGEKVNNLKPYKICKKGIARTFQIPLIFPSLSVYENIGIGAHFGGDGRDDEKRLIAGIIDLVGLQGKENIEASHLRLFDKKMTMLGIALATQPKLLMLDEPAGGLNPTEIQQSVTLFERLNEEFGITLIVIEHLMKVLMGISERLMIIHDGEMIRLGKPLEVGKDKRVIEIYLGTEYA
ncbi:MAG: ABC transporter ATP-binding protein [Desulfobacterales bacterium]|nr:MAG: ABC transporter ATP-binding protein [Desulfobacterales bacterium]